MCVKKNTMMKSIQAVRGMHDCLPVKSRILEKIERIIRDILSSYGFKEIRIPIIEKTCLFKRAIGEITDVIEKEMYIFEDKNGKSIALRPEGTAGCVRAGIEHGLFHHKEQRLWYMGPMFRYERPQKGRYRQFHQIGAEVFGINGPNIDAELLMLNLRCWKVLGVSKNLRLEINSIGSIQERVNYLSSFLTFLEHNKKQLDKDCLRRMYSNPFRILDSKNPRIQDLLKKANPLTDYFEKKSKEHFSGLCSILDFVGIKYTINSNLVRGLDYYNATVFEWVVDTDKEKNTVCAGGRYDSLVEKLGGRSTPAIGFAIGIERLVSLVEEVNPIFKDVQDIDIYFIAFGYEVQLLAIKLVEKIRDSIPKLKIMINFSGGNLKKQFSRADKSRARFALILGENEIKNEQIILKNLNTGEQEILLQSKIIFKLHKLFS